MMVAVWGKERLLKPIVRSPQQYVDLVCGGYTQDLLLDLKKIP